jgi:hypothetical protein
MEQVCGTLLDGLIRLHALESFLRAYDKSGRLYGPRYFTNRDWEETLSRQNRRVSFRLRDYGRCLACSKPLSRTALGDHLIPVSKGGPDGSVNYVPLCQEHNSAKGTKDFFEWWVSSRFDLKTLPRDPKTPVLQDLLCSYARLTFQFSPIERLREPIPWYIQGVLLQLKPLLPSEKHWVLLNSLRSKASNGTTS